MGRLAQDFDISLDATSADGPLVSLMLVPRRDAAAVGKLRLTVARDSGEIRSAEIYDPLGNVSRLQFDEIRRNQGLPDDTFVFHVPPGIDVITAPAAQ